jgi:hypothetical protein
MKFPNTRKASWAAGLRRCVGVTILAGASLVQAQTTSPAAAAAASAPTTPAAAPAAAQTVAPAAAPASAPLDVRIQQAKADVVKLNRDLLVLEEELLFPANTQIVVFLSMDVGKLFQLESVQVRLNDQLLASHLYTPHEVQALHRGAVQRLHLGHLKAGKHTLTAFFTGQGPHDRDYRRGATLSFDKPAGAKLIELQIKDLQAKLQPEFQVKELP